MSFRSDLPEPNRCRPSCEKERGSHGLSARRARRTKSRGPKGPQLEVGDRRAPRLLVSSIKSIHVSGLNLLLHLCCNRISNHIFIIIFMMIILIVIIIITITMLINGNAGDLNPGKHFGPLDSSLPQKNVEPH